ncbi:MAG: molecular chaperone DnaJ [Erysipelotrichaceae bacterium]
MAKRDYYEILGINKNAEQSEIKKAYRKLAKKYHPDVNKEAGADVKFKEVQEAYDCLADANKKAQYDQFGHAAFDQNSGFGSQGGFGGAGGFEDFGDIFSSFFGGGFGGGRRQSNAPRKGQDRLMRMSIDFMEAIKGKTASIQLDVDEKCGSCNGSGAHSSSDIKNCTTCNGQGRVMSQQRTAFGVFQQETICPHCHGSGKEIKNKCKKCHGSGYEHKTVKVDIKIPAGINTGQQLRISGKGEAGLNGGPNGDLIVEILVKNHKNFIRDGKNIHIKIPISLTDAVLGAKIDVPTVYGDVELKIPEGTQPNTQFRLKGKGVIDIRGGSHGDQYVEVSVDIPKRLSVEEKDLFNKIKLKQSKSKGVFEKFKDAFN